MTMIRLLAALCSALWLSAQPVAAQSALSTDNRSISVTTGGTFQAIAPTDNTRRMLQIENNNTNTDDCWINDDGTVAVGDTTATAKTVHGAAITAQKASIRLTPGGQYTRYYPYVPDGPIVGTCTTTGDSIYAAIH